jgi:hypothetical protein
LKNQKTRRFLKFLNLNRNKKKRKKLRTLLGNIRESNDSVSDPIPAKKAKVDDDNVSVATEGSKKKDGKTKKKGVNSQESCIEEIQDYTKNIGTQDFTHSNLERIHDITRKYNIKSIQALIDKVRIKMETLKPVAIVEGGKYEEEDSERYKSLSYQELKSKIAKLKIEIDILEQCKYRKNPKVKGYKSAIMGLNKLQCMLNEELVI